MKKLTLDQLLLAQHALHTAATHWRNIAKDVREHDGDAANRVASMLEQQATDAVRIASLLEEEDE